MIDPQKRKYQSTPMHSVTEAKLNILHHSKTLMMHSWLSLVSNKATHASWDDQMVASRLPRCCHWHVVKLLNWNCKWISMVQLKQYHWLNQRGMSGRYDRWYTTVLRTKISIEGTLHQHLLGIIIRKVVADEEEVCKEVQAVMPGCHLILLGIHGVDILLICITNPSKPQELLTQITGGNLTTTQAVHQGCRDVQLSKQTNHLPRWILLDQQQP